MNSDEVMGGPSTFTLLYAMSKFHDENPKSYGVFLAAFREAIAAINADKHAAAQILLDSPDGKGSTLGEIAEIVEDPDVRFTTAPQNVMTYATFLADVGQIKTRPAMWQDMFFPEIHDAGGS